ncbi:uncharacterized protein LOC113862424 [Abrus precatorius]|uniref:Uncharacterized protein LOC113862424 n=1 Tax=Abrus precatorius TaxID=3816 RepID=A0A8B8L528_ABRPR|nr:uncharacterized protein LOC113862424 [Abrus precatorius]
MATSETEEHVTLKLMVTKERNKVLFAEAGKDFVDVLFSFLTLPLGTIIRLVSKESNMQPIEVGSLSSLYQSVENLNKKYLCTDTCKEMLLRPRNSMEAYCKDLKLNIDDTAYRFVRMSNATFMITDDLNILPMSLETTFSLFKNSGIENMSQVNEMTVNVTKKQVVNILKSCMLSESILTDLFLKKNLLSKRLEQTRPSLFDLKINGSSKQINVKLFKRKSDGNIVFAEGKEDFADFLFSFLTFPLVAVVHLMKGFSSIGTVDALYKSIVDLFEDYWTTEEVKDKLVFPGLAPQFKLSNQLLPIYESLAPESFSYVKKQSSCKVNNIWETFGNPKIVDPISEKASEKGFTKGLNMYVATDDLVVMPMSSNYVVSLLNKMDIPLSDLEEQVVSIGIKASKRG